MTQQHSKLTILRRIQYVLFKAETMRLF